MPDTTDPAAQADDPCRQLTTEPADCLLGRLVPDDCGPGCAAYDPAAPVALDDAERIRCEVWTRVMGYHRPVSAFNPGKRSEHRDRRLFVEPANAR